MAEPTGIFIEFEIEVSNIKKLLNYSFKQAVFGKKLGYYFSELLYNCSIDSSNVFLFNYNNKKQKCLIAYLLNYFEKESITPFQDILHIISELKKVNTTDYAIVSTTFPNILEAYKITYNKVSILNLQLPENVVQNLMDKYWAFSENGTFPEPKNALNKRNYFYKNFKNYYKKYLIHIEEIERPNKIAQATKDKPYHLFEKFYSYDNKVFQFRNFTNQVIELPDADPLTLRNVSGIYADKNNVYLPRLTPNSPPNINPIRGKGNNPNAIWEFYIVPNIDGETFNYVKEMWDTVYWKDKNMVFIYDRENRQLKKVDQADSSTFQYLGFCFGKDKDHLFYLDKTLTVDVKNYTLNKNGFLYDANSILHYQHQLPLDPKTFKILEYESEINPFMGTFILEDKNGKYKYNRDWEEQPLKPLI